MDQELEILRVGVDPVTLELTSEPFVLLTRRGYAPAVQVKQEDTGEEKVLYISSFSISSALEPLREANDDKFTGIRIRVNKESKDRFAKYIVESPDAPAEAAPDTPPEEPGGDDGQ
jgi:hypothetical protein